MELTTYVIHLTIDIFTPPNSKVGGIVIIFFFSFKHCLLFLKVFLKNNMFFNSNMVNVKDKNENNRMSISKIQPLVFHL